MTNSIDNLRDLLREREAQAKRDARTALLDFYKAADALAADPSSVTAEDLDAILHACGKSVEDLVQEVKLATDLADVEKLAEDAVVNLPKLEEELSRLRARAEDVNKEYVPTMRALGKAGSPAIRKTRLLNGLSVVETLIPELKQFAKAYQDALRACTSAKQAIEERSALRHETEIRRGLRQAPEPVVQCNEIIVSGAARRMGPQEHYQNLKEIVAAEEARKAAVKTYSV